VAALVTAYDWLGAWLNPLLLDTVNKRTSLCSGIIVDDDTCHHRWSWLIRSVDFCCWCRRHVWWLLHFFIGIPLVPSTLRQRQHRHHHLICRHLKGLNGLKSQVGTTLYGKPISKLRSVTCRMGSHTVTCHPTQMNAPHLNHSQADWYSIYLPCRDGRLSWSWVTYLLTVSSSDSYRYNLIGKSCSATGSAKLIKMSRLRGERQGEEVHLLKTLFQTL